MTRGIGLSWLISVNQDMSPEVGDGVTFSRVTVWRGGYVKKLWEGRIWGKWMLLERQSIVTTTSTCFENENK